MAKNLNPNNRVHLEIQTHRKNPIGLLRTSYRDENNKVKHQTLSRITGLDRLLPELYVSISYYSSFAYILGSEL